MTVVTTHRGRITGHAVASALWLPAINSCHAEERPCWRSASARAARRTVMIGSAQPKPPALEIIRTGTRLRPVPLVPQIRLYQAGDPVSLWQRTELVAGRTGLDP